MNVNKDLAQPTGDFVRLEDGKYLYETKQGEFDIDKFNLEFEQYRIKRKKEMERERATKLAELNRPKPKLPIYKDSLGKIFIDTKDALFNMLDDLLQRNFSLNVFTKDNRLFYVGLTMIFIAVFMYLYTIVIGESHSENKIGSGFLVTHLHDVNFRQNPLKQTST